MSDNFTIGARVKVADGFGFGTVIGMVVALPNGRFCFVNKADEMRPLTYEEEEATPISESEEAGLADMASYVVGEAVGKDDGITCMAVSKLAGITIGVEQIAMCVESLRAAMDSVGKG